MEAAADTPLQPEPHGSWLAAHWRTGLGVVAILVLAPLLWLAATHPLGGTSGGAASSSGGALTGKTAPDFTLKDPSGKSVSLKQFRGKPVIVNFWATWCEPCKQEMPELEQLYREHQRDGLVVLGVSIDSPQDAKLVPEFLKQGSPAVGSYTFPVVLDDQQQVTRQYHLLGVPSSFFVDKDGVVRVIQPRVMDRALMLEGLKHILPSA